MKNGRGKDKQKIWHIQNLKISYREWIKKCWTYCERWRQLFKVWKFAVYCRSPKEKDRCHNNTKRKNCWTWNQYRKYGSDYQREYAIWNTLHNEANVLSKFLGKHTGRVHDDNVTKSVNTVNLPKLEISKFNSDPIKWQSFFNLFQAAVGKSPNLTGVEKFNYLRCFFEGDALDAIGGFSLTNDNYKEALELLQNRYGNTQQIIAAHITL